MPWTCVSCGRQGEREGTAEASWCTRAGMGSMKGELRCCNCMLASGWDQYDEQACKVCMRLAKRRLPQDSARRQEGKQVDAVMETLVKPKKRIGGSDVAEMEGVKVPEGYSKIAVFEFDDVLFRTPDQPKWWPFNSYSTMMNSLLPPTIPAEPSDEWWIMPSLEKARDACEDPNTWAVLVTFRHDGFRSRIQALLQSRGLKFDEIHLRPLRPFLHSLGRTADGTAGYGPLKSNFIDKGPSKAPDMHLLVILGDMVQRTATRIEEVQVWASSERAQALQEKIRSTAARAFQFTAVEEEKMQAGQPSDAELQAMHEVMKYVKQFSKSGNVITNKFKAAPPRPRRSGKFSTAPPRKTVEEKKTAVPTGKSRRPKGSAVQWPADMYLASLSNNLRLYPMLLEEEEDDWDEEEDEEEAGPREGEGEEGEGEGEGEGEEAPEMVEREPSGYEDLANRIEFQWIESAEVAHLAAGFMEREWSGDLTADVMSVASDDDVISVSSAMSDFDVISLSSNLTEDLTRRDGDVAELCTNPSEAGSTDPALGVTAPVEPKGVWGARAALADVMKPPEGGAVAASSPQAAAKPVVANKSTASSQEDGGEEALGDEGDKAMRRGLKGGKFH